jgi:hypothetical protein
MPFVWVNDPRIPEAVEAPVIGPTEVSTEVHVVANTVNVSPILGTVSYNTRNVGYDVLYTLPSLNVHDLHVTHLEADNVQVHLNASINTATINVATINTANIVSATIANGVMGVNPSSNDQIATKEYVDALAANSTPTGGNLQLLILAAGDLLVGVSDNTAERFPVGTIDKQVLMAESSSGNTGMRWTGPIGSTSSHRGMVIGTNWAGGSRNSQIVLLQTDEIVMDDGQRISTGWNGLVADTSLSGAGGIDTGTILPNTCYEIYAIRNSSSGAQALLLHRAKDTRVDIHYAPTAAVSRSINFVYGATQSVTINVAQKFIAQSNGPFLGIDLTIGRTGAPVGNLWVTLETNDATNNASGTILATSRRVSAGRIGNLTSDSVRTRFPFDTTANVTSNTTYWAVVHADYTQGNVQTNINYIKIFGDSATPSFPYANGVCKFFNANTNGWALSNSSAAIDSAQGPSNLYFRTFVEANSTPVTMPTGYDQKCLVSYCSTTFHSTLREYHQREYKMSMSYHYEWMYYQNGGSNALRAESPGANNSAQVAFPEPIHMGEYVPPVPCLVWIYKLSALSGAAALGHGNLGCTDLPVPTLVSESSGSLTATIGPGEPKALGPILVEFNAHVNHGGGTTLGELYIAGIEF